MEIEIKTKVKLTEDKDKVIKALKNIFSDLEYNIEQLPNKYLSILGKSKNIDRFKELIRSEAILDTARDVLEKGAKLNYTKFKINKQAAYMGLINFDSDIHGGIFVKIICDNEKDLQNKIIDIAPRTKNGRIIIKNGKEVDYKIEEEINEEINNISNE